MGWARNTVSTPGVGVDITERVMKRMGNNKKATRSTKVGKKAALLTASSSSSSWVVCGFDDNGHDLPNRL